MALLIFAVAADPSANLGFGSDLRILLLVASRLMMGMACGTIWQMRNIVTEMSTLDQQVFIEVITACAASAGIGLGPLLSSVTGQFFSVDTPREVAGCSSLVVSMAWALLAFVTAFVMPPASPVDTTKRSSEATNTSVTRSACPDQIKDVAHEKVGVEKPIREMRIVSMTGMKVNWERIFTSSALEVSTALLLETKSGFKPNDIGFALAMAFVPAIPFTVVVFLARQKQLVRDATLAFWLQSVCFVSSFVLFEPVAHLLFGSERRLNAIGLLITDSVIFSAGFAVSGILLGLAFQCALPGTDTSAQSINCWNIAVGQTLARALAPPVGRFLVTAFGRNSYALVQCVLMSYGVHAAYIVQEAMVTVEKYDLQVERCRSSTPTSED